MIFADSMIISAECCPKFVDIYFCPISPTYYAKDYSKYSIDRSQFLSYHAPQKAKLDQLAIPSTDP